MFIDSSVFVAILSDEEDGPDWLRRIEAAPVKKTSSVVVLETVMRLSSKLRATPTDVEIALWQFFDQVGITITPIDEPEARTAIQAFSEFGKGRGHPAQLNIADCLSYACAKNLKVPLLYKGDDFASTDMA